MFVIDLQGAPESLRFIWQIPTSVGITRHWQVQFPTSSRWCDVIREMEILCLMVISPGSLHGRICRGAHHFLVALVSMFWIGCGPIENIEHVTHLKAPAETSRIWSGLAGLRA